MFEVERPRVDPDPASHAAAAPLQPTLAGLTDATDEEKYCSAWLLLQCTRIPGAAAGLLRIRRPAVEMPSLDLTWPERNLDLPDLAVVADRAYSERRRVVALGRTDPVSNSAQAPALIVGLPIGLGSEPIAAAAVALTISGGATLISPESLTERMQWGAGWLEVLPWARRSQEYSKKSAQAAASFDLLAAVAAQPGLRATTIAVVNHLAVALQCDRVSLGLIRRSNSIRVRAISHSATFKNESRLVDAIENAMEEAVDQHTSVIFPPVPETGAAISAAHRTLADVVHAAAPSLISLVLSNGRGRPIGAITLERHRANPFDEETLHLAEAVTSLIGPLIGLQLRANRLVAGRIADRLAGGLTALAGPRRPTLKLAALAVVALAVFLAFGESEHRVTAKAVLEGEVQRAVVGPFEGYIQSAPVRAGDTVKAGALLAALDDRDLLLERQKWRAEREKLMQKQRESLAKHDRTSLAILDAQIRQAESQVALAEEKLSRSRMLAPFDGIVVSGDLTQKLGSPIEKGKLLFEIAPLNSYRLIIKVDERDVRYVSVGQTGTVALAGMPWSPLPLIISQITPVAVADEGRNAFQIEAKLNDIVGNLRPGMEGVVKIETGRRPTLWIWTRSLLEWCRLVAWQYLP
jgi:multidrug resistance efflux pump